MYALIIDDNINNIGVLVELLLMEGINSFTVQKTKNFSTEDIPELDLIFLDLEMPDLNGYEVFEKLKADPRLADVPTVAYSVHTAEINNARKRGFDSFLSKPLSLEDFPKQIARILRGDKVWG